MSELKQNTLMTSRDWRSVIGLVLLIALVFIVPVALAVIIFLVARKIKLGKLEAVGIALVSLALMIFVPSASSAYFEWLFSLVGVSKTPFPFISIFSYALFLSSMFILLQNNTIVLRGIKSSVPMSLGRNEVAEVIPSKSNATVIGKPPTAKDTVRKTSETAAVPKFILGLNAKKEYDGIAEEALSATHMLLFGQTGMGKTETIKALIGAVMDKGWDVTVLDLKDDIGEGGLRHWCRRYASAHRLPYQEISSSDTSATPSHYFDPFVGISSDEARELVLSTQEFGDVFWESINKNQLAQACMLLWAAHQADPATYPKPTLYSLGEFFRRTDMPQEATKMVKVVKATFDSNTYSDRNFHELTTPSPKTKEAAQLFSNRIEGLYNTDVGKKMLRENRGQKNLDVEQRGLTYIGLDSLGKADLTRATSSLVLQRLNILASHRITGKKELGLNSTPDRGRLIVIDEANRINRDIIENMLSRVRSAGMRVVLSTQGPADWQPKDGKSAGLDSLTNNCGIVMTMQLGNMLNAELCADLLGKSPQTSVSATLKNEGLAGGIQTGATMSQVRDWIVQPDALRELGRGKVVVRVSAPNYKIYWLDISMRDPEEIVPNE